MVIGRTEKIRVLAALWPNTEITTQRRGSVRRRSHRSKKIKVRLSLEGVGWGILVFFFAKETVQRDELITFPEEKLLPYPL